MVFKMADNRRLIPLEVVRKFPKADLHRHFDGSICISTIIELAKAQGVELLTFDEEEPNMFITVDGNCKPPVEYLRGSEIMNRVLQEREALTRCFFEVCEDALNDGIAYVEVRFSPILHTEKGLSLQQVMDVAPANTQLATRNFHRR